MVRLVGTRVQIRQLRLQISDLFSSLLILLFLLLFKLLSLTLQKGDLFLQVSILAAECRLKLLQGLPLLLVFALPEFFFRRDPFNLRLGLIVEFLAHLLHFLVENATGVLISFLKLLDFAI